jgi:D-alanyl-D-alanine carboxypeptidase (penicillin-binding protein 5/6)
MRGSTAIVIKATALMLVAIMVFGFCVTALMAAVKSIYIREALGEGMGQTSARAMATVDMGTGRLLYSKNADAKLPMASTTKIVTAITVIEHAPDLDKKVRVDDRAIGIEGTSIYIQKGEELTIRELLYGLMLRSGNDCSVALALSISPTVEEFCALMDALAIKAGAMNSSFKNPHGLDEDGHFTTAHDLALITAYAMKNPTFAEIAKTQAKKISGVDYPRVMQNKNRLLKSLPGCVGVKTGFTGKAGRCYVGALESGNRTVICVVLNCGPMFEEAATLMKSGLSDFDMRRLIKADEFIDFTDDEHRAIAVADFSKLISEYELSKLNIDLDGEDVVVRIGSQEIYRHKCNVLQCEA